VHVQGVFGQGQVMTDSASDATLKVVVRQSGVSFYARRVMQRWERGEITTDAARELLEPGEVARLIGAYISMRGP
jgi:hypothetical protein